MIINNMKIKDDITFLDRVNAAEFITSYCFIGGNYTPYYEEIGEVEGVIKYFIEGIEFEKGESLYENYLTNENLNKLVNMFIVNDKYTTDYAVIMRWVRENVSKLVEHEKQKLIHRNEDLTKIVDAAEVIIDTFGNFSKLNISKLSDEDMETSLKFMKLLTESGVSEESMTNTFRKAANVNPDKQNSEIIDALKNENKKLKQQLAKRNVAGSRKAIDFKGWSISKLTQLCLV